VYVCTVEVGSLHSLKLESLKLNHGTKQPSYRSGRRLILSPRDERTLVQKGQINPRTTAKGRVKMLEETGAKVSVHSKTSPIST
jgi:hypothetical protein